MVFVWGYQQQRRHVSVKSWWKVCQTVLCGRPHFPFHHHHQSSQSASQCRSGPNTKDYHTNYRITHMMSFPLRCVAILALFVLGEAFRGRSMTMVFGNLFKKPSTSASQKAKIDALKADLFSNAQGTSNGVKASAQSKLKISSIVSDLEKLNTNKKISSSPLMNGNWKLIYTTNDGSSAGKLGPFVGRVDQDIDVDSKKYVNFVRLGNGIVTGALTG